MLIPQEVQDIIKGEFLYDYGVYTFINPYSMKYTWKNPEVYKEFDAIYVDGKLLQIILSVLGLDVKQRLSFDFSSLAGPVLRFAETKGFKVAVIGSDEQSLREFISVIENFYPSINIVFSRNGFFNNEQEKSSIQHHILESGCNFIICGMGSPQQDTFLIELKNLGWHGMGFTCGGFIHQTAVSGDSYYPKFINRLNLRFLYRMFKEPHTIRRYFLEYPKNIARLFFGRM